MDQVEEQDVNNTAEVTTAGESSNTQETSGDTTDSTVVETEPKTVPYDRFSEVNEKYRNTELTNAQLKAKVEAYEKMQAGQPVNTSPEAQQRELIKEQLKGFMQELAPEMGFVSKDELVRQQQDQALESTLKSLSDKYNGKDGRPAFNKQEVVNFAVSKGISDPEIAYKAMHEEALMNWRIEQAIAKSKGLQTETSNGTGSANTGVSNDDVRASALKGDANARKLLFKRIAKSHINNS